MIPRRALVEMLGAQSVVREFGWRLTDVLEFLDVRAPAKSSHLPIQPAGGGPQRSAPHASHAARSDSDCAGRWLSGRGEKCSQCGVEREIPKRPGRRGGAVPKGMRLTAIDNEMLVVVCQDERTLYRLSVDDFQDQDEEEISRDQIRL